MSFHEALASICKIWINILRSWRVENKLDFTLLLLFPSKRYYRNILMIAFNNFENDCVTQDSEEMNS